MPTQDKIDQVAKIKNWIDGSTIAISTDYTGMSVTNMTELRRALRESEDESFGGLGARTCPARSGGGGRRRR